jgi:hypothetical protein
MGPEAERPLAEVCQSFKRSASKLRRAVVAVAASKPLHFEISWRQGEDPGSSFVETPELVRLATLLRPVTKLASPIEFRGVWSRLIEEGLVEEATRERVDAFMASADVSPVRVVLNGEEISVRDLYFAYGEGKIFDSEPEAGETLNLLMFGPMQQMVPFLYYSACLTYSDLVLAIREAIQEVEHRRATDGADDGRKPRCIYCLTRDGDFGSEDHVIPESLGNNELVLRGAVCLACNNSLSRLEQFLLDFEPVAFLRVLNVSYTKKDKLPRADFRDFTMEKVSPRDVHFISKTNKDIFIHEEDVSPGVSRFSMPITSRRPFDPVLIGRAVFKIGLGLVAYDRGVDFACDQRYNTARDFIAGRLGMPNNLLIEGTLVPNPSVSTAWRDAGTVTPVVLDIFGLRIAFNLEASAYPVGDVALPEGLMQFGLGGDTKPGDEAGG